jgi:uncharacterized protein with LGFP repeats
MVLSGVLALGMVAGGLAGATTHPGGTEAAACLTLAAKFQALGGISGLGKPVGTATRGPNGGLWQDYSSGASLYWSPQSCAHLVRGLIRLKYVALGGPAVYGYPLTDELAAANSGRYNDFQNGGSIYWSVPTGAQAVYGLINARYRALDGPGGPLGYPTTGETAGPNDGRLNDFQGGGIYWTPATDAHAVFGAIGLEYAALGGPAVFGYPLTDELAGPNGGRYNDFENGGSIYWSPATGAHEVHGAIKVEYDALGGPAVYGYPLSDETAGPNGGRYSDFENGGSIYWTATTGAHEVHGAIKVEYDALGGPAVYGYPLSDETVGPNGGRYNDFENGGSIYWSPATGAHEVHGAIRVEYDALGGPAVYGYPLSDETVGPNGGRYNDFENGGSIYWSADTGAHEVHGAINATYKGFGAAASCLGYPVSDETDDGNGGRYNNFQNGQLSWTPDGGVAGPTCGAGTFQGDVVGVPANN